MYRTGRGRRGFGLTCQDFALDPLWKAGARAEGCEAWS